AIALMGSVRIRESRVFSLKDLWAHSFAMAIGMRTVAAMLPPEKRPPEDLLFLSGLLHDMGYLALAYLSPERFDVFIRNVESHPEIPATDIEKTELGVGHAEIGGILARSWHLPEEIISVIEGHHDEKPDMNNIPLILSRLVESITGEGAIHRPPSMSTVPPPELEAVGLGPEDLDETREILEMQWALSFTS
ncbi:MAG TPA: HDOD domain-containing protein, partial [Burkholderiales bacterium]|nr:HDOD domain-containing protein [Burkholderiales bacterium]